MPRHEICGLFLILAHFLRVSVIAFVTHVIFFSGVFSSIHRNATVSIKTIPMTVGGLYFYGSCSHGLQVSCGGG
jgi:hypothetical protein